MDVEITLDEKSKESDENLFLRDFGHIVTREDVDNKKVLNLYDSYAKTYEEDMLDIQFKSPALTVQYFRKHAARFGLGQDCLILDVGAGTGTVGELLKKYNYTSVDGLEPCVAMLDKAKAKNIYRQLFEAGVGDEPMPIEDGVYDAALVSGALVPGHIHHRAFLDILRVLKPGGLVVNTMREEFTWNSAECDVRETFARWQTEGRWDIIEWAIPDMKYFGDQDGIVHVYRKPLNKP